MSWVAEQSGAVFLEKSLFSCYHPILVVDLFPSASTYHNAATTMLHSRCDDSQRMAGSFISLETILGINIPFLFHWARGLFLMTILVVFGNIQIRSGLFLASLLYRPDYWPWWMVLLFPHRKQWSSILVTIGVLFNSLTNVLLSQLLSFGCKNTF